MELGKHRFDFSEIPSQKTSKLSHSTTFKKNGCKFTFILPSPTIPLMTMNVNQQPNTTFIPVRNKRSDCKCYLMTYSMVPKLRLTLSV